MDVTSIRLLTMLIDGEKEANEILRLLGIKTQWLARIVKRLEEENYVEKTGTTIKLKKTSKAILFRDIVQIVDAERLLSESNEIIISNIHKSITIDELIRKSGLSRTTVYRSILDLKSIGAIQKDGDTVRLDETKEQLILFIKLLNVEKNQKYENGNVEVIYQNKSTTLRKVPQGKIAKGVSTGFTLFADYGIEYYPTHDFFCDQKDDLEIQDVLLHAVYSASHIKNAMELLVCMLFYVKNKDKLDVLQLRKKSSELEIGAIWLDIEAYIRRNNLKNPDLFLAWGEFLSKAKLYNIPIDRYALPEARDSLFREISGELKKPMMVYLFGGENMRIKSLKQSTKDCDLAVESKADFDDLTQILTNMKYSRIQTTTYSNEDMRIDPSGIFEHKAKSRIDLFASTIMRSLTVSSTMKESSDVRDFGMLKVGLLRNEHVFLLKAITTREGDIHDMAALVTGSPNTPHNLQHGSFDWNVVWAEILNQEHINPAKEFAWTIFEQISYLAVQTGITAPFLDKLRIHVMDRLIKSLLRGGSLPIKHIVLLLGGGEISESMLRNRIDALEKTNIIEKQPIGRTTRVTLLGDNEFTEKELPLTVSNFEIYLMWRFVHKEIPSSQHIQKLVKELTGLGFKNIGEIDMIIKNSIEVLRQYETEHSSDRHFDAIGSTRICIGLNYEEIGARQSSDYYVSQFKKYNGMLKDGFIPEYPGARHVTIT